ncbi:MAG: DotA/TraY family protein [Desulfovibrionaceae bacterium]|nr:DotA/TraY family protein [Desulfovibrionaceae bacterium]
MAQTDITGMLLEVDEPRVTDLSREVLTTIFGDNWWNLAAQTSSNQAIFELLLTLNAICAVVIAWLMILTLLISTTGAAQEGRVMGGKYLNPWVPLRFAFAMAAVTPIQHGLCAMQLLLLTCVGVSVNLANSMLDTALNWIQTESSLTAFNNTSKSYSRLQGTLDVGESVTGASKMSGKTLAVQILQAEAFLSYLNLQLGCDSTTSNFAKHLTEVEDPTTQAITLYFNGTGRLECKRGYLQKDREAFGGFSLKVNPENEAIEPVDLRDRVRLLKELITQVELTGAPRHFATMKFAGDLSEAVTVLEDRTLVQAQGVQYAVKLAELAKGRGDRPEKLKQKLDMFLLNAKSQGWFGLGSHYWTLATLEQELQAADDLRVEFLAPKFRSFADCLPFSFATAFWPRLNEASYLGDKPSDDLWSKLWEYLAPFTGLTKRFAYALEDSPDALLATVHLARWTSGTCSAILVAAEAAKLAAVGGSKLLTKNAAMRVADFFTGGGEASDSVLKALLEDLSFFLKLIILPLWCFSTCVAYLVPAIPFLIWVAALAGWVAITLEAIIAAPIWLIGHAMPEGEGFAGAHGRSGYMLVLSILLRPCLLVLSMLTCFMVMRATGSIIGSLMAPFIDSQADLSSVTLGLVGCVFMFIITCGAITLLTWKLFDLVTKMPDRIIRWVGQQIASFGSEANTALNLKTFSHSSHNAALLAQSSANSVKRGLANKSSISRNENLMLRDNSTKVNLNKVGP